MSRMRFGIFLAPFHDHRTNPNAALHRDLDLIRHLDYLGYDEVWVGEHHSCGTEIVADPMIFCAVAIEQTRSIKLGTGVVSVPYHNPLWTADRIIQLDHLSRGRFMFGAGPGSLTTDAHMIGIQASEQRRMLEEGMEAIMHLLRKDEPLTMRTDWFNLVDAKCQLPLYSQDLEIVVAAVASPSGPRLAGRHGIGLLSIGATMQIGADVLALHYDRWEEVAAQHNNVVDRREWRLVGFMHCAETKEQAMRDVEYGIDDFFDYLQNTSAIPHLRPEGSTLEERIAWINESGIGAIGTTDDCARQIDALLKQSGGFGSYLCMHHDYANPAATKRSYELLAQRVFPQFQNNTTERLADATDRARAIRGKLMDEQNAALAAWTAKHEAERAATRAGN
jgi:alkanesulfonate monooxygenase SsuD/methylene tetrahydromethanopterin reductase-like flavin-dependent oxidoreductase (luciferase family)